MSEPTGRPGRYQRSTGGLLGALVVTVVAVLALVGVRSLTAPDRPDGVSSTDWQAQVRAGRSDARLTIPAPASLPSGWRATSAIYTTGIEPTWQLGMLTAEEEFVGVYERIVAPEDLVEEHVGEAAEPGGDVRIGDVTWQEWTDPGGDYGLVRAVPEPTGQSGAVLVVGTTEPGQVRDFAATLT